MKKFGKSLSKNSNPDSIQTTKLGTNMATTFVGASTSPTRFFNLATSHR